MPAFQYAAQGIGIHDIAPAYVDEQSALLHTPQLGFIEQVLGLLCSR